jgi:site-specific recombinase XerD
VFLETGHPHPSRTETPSATTPVGVAPPFTPQRGLPTAPQAGDKRTAHAAGLDEREEPASSHRAQACDWINSNGVETTDKAYSTYQKRWIKFCLELGIEPEQALPEHVVLFMKDLRDSGLSISTINSVALSAVAANYKLSDESSPTGSKMVRAAKQVVIRTAKPAGPGASPLPPSYVVRMVEASSNKLIDVRDTFLISLMMAGFLRQQEAADLLDKDVWLEEKEEVEMLLVLVVKGKTDQGRNGHTIVIGAATNHHQACPIALYKRWKARRNAKAEYLFHQVKSPAKLSKCSPNSILKKLLKSIGVNPKLFSSHSCRKGGCSTAAARGISITVLKRHGRWRSDAIFAYITDSLELKLSVSQAVF